jgi:hypothetical protein
MKLAVFFVFGCLCLVFLIYIRAPIYAINVRETKNPVCDSEEYLVCCDNKYPGCVRCCPDKFHDWRRYKKIYPCEWLIGDFKEQNGTCFIGKSNLRKNITLCVMKTNNWESDCKDE